MKTVLLANIGNSDIKFEGEFLKDKQRTKSEEILKGLNEDFELYKSELQFPILEPILDRLGSIDLLILFATDQHQGLTQLKFWEKDTINSAKVIKYILENEEKYKQKVNCIEIIGVYNSPNDYDQMFSEYHDIFKNRVNKLLKSKKIENVDEIYISMTGGTSACNLALMYSSFYDCKYGFKQFVYRSESEKEDPVKFLELGRAIQRQQLIQLAEQFLFTYNYEGIIYFISEMLSDDKLLMNILKVMHYKKNFRFEEAQKLLKESLNKIEGYSRVIVKELFEDVTNIKSGIDQLDMNFEKEKRITKEVRRVLSELFWNAKICYETGNYVDFLGRFFRLQESLLRIMFENITGIGTGKKNQGNLKKEIYSNKNLENYLSKNKVDLNKDLNRYSYFYINKYYLGEEDMFIKWVEKGAFSVGEGKEKLVDYRNKSILGHEFEGINAELIKKLC